MTKTQQTFLLLIFGVVIVITIINLMSNSELKQIRRDLIEAKKSADSALSELGNARHEIQSLKDSTNKMQAFVVDIQTFVEANYASNRKADMKYKREIDEMLKRADSLYYKSIIEIHKGYVIKPLN